MHPEVRIRLVLLMLFLLLAVFMALNPYARAATVPMQEASGDKMMRAGHPEARALLDGLHPA